MKGTLGVEDIRDKMKEHRFRWCGHVMQCAEEQVKTIMGLQTK